MPLITLPWPLILRVKIVTNEHSVYLICTCKQVVLMVKCFCFPQEFGWVYIFAGGKIGLKVWLSLNSDIVILALWSSMLHCISLIFLVELETCLIVFPICQSSLHLPHLVIIVGNKGSAGEIMLLAKLLQSL